MTVISVDIMFIKPFATIFSVHLLKQAKHCGYLEHLSWKMQ